MFGDYCSGRLAALEVRDRTVVRDLTLGQVDQLVAVRQGPDGELWAISIGGQVTRIAAA